ncbi:hypothetical protein KFK09_019545 [Dendrobium nobile]|uniref:Uncharacterized protein n=1 Tax=Dendrobium nobile TaxID=94219 RepID=A0A8T3AX03_DENNO|nr:hypothetical protein KFK09_019545 [Dendrobium nobile]
MSCPTLSLSWLNGLLRLICFSPVLVSSKNKMNKRMAQMKIFVHDKGSPTASCRGKSLRASSVRTREGVVWFSPDQRGAASLIEWLKMCSCSREEGKPVGSVVFLKSHERCSSRMTKEKAIQ